ncbi:MULTISPECIES: hypothetical protein [Rhizobium/Agrobacterium group]|uniref:hypothetical protein n=1 Tax=Rhizobium/Agrobacterium group TaxID=227290 RepID=UPI000AA8AD98|nr:MULTISPECIES: hypothetical protein [Rhizobium/Agrobacterium group]MCZ7488610.1 hypothetical protein [Rhizobium rhizogenes]
MLSKKMARMFVLTATALTTSICVLSSPAVAGPLDTAYSNAMVPYVVLKRGSVECGKPAGEHISYKTRLLGILGRVPSIDLIAADREIERAFEREAPRTSYTECSDALLLRYHNALNSDAERALQYLSEQVSELR